MSEDETDKQPIGLIAQKIVNSAAIIIDKNQ